MCGRTILSFHFYSVFWSAKTLFCIPKGLKVPRHSCIKANLKMYMMLIDIPIFSLIKNSRVYMHSCIFFFIQKLICLTEDCLYITEGLEYVHWRLQVQLHNICMR